jgi:hypothetical protein
MLAQQVAIGPLAGNLRVGPRAKPLIAVSLGMASATWGADKLTQEDEQKQRQKRDRAVCEEENAPRVEYGVRG